LIALPDFAARSAESGDLRNGTMAIEDTPSAEVSDGLSEQALAEVMRVVPLGAGVLAGSAVALLVLGYLAIYLLVFLPRGTVG
jgi:hypothetical protein